MIGPRSLLLLLSLTLSVLANAQDYVEVVHLKNGSMIRGLIIEQVPGQHIKVQTSDRSVFVFPYSDIEKITREEIPAEAAPQGSRSKITREGFMSANELSVGVKVGSAYGNNVTMSFISSNGVWLADGVVGLGLGVGIKHDPADDLLMLPLLADLRFASNSGTTVPLITLQWGYLASIKDQEVVAYPDIAPYYTYGPEIIKVRPSGIQGSLGVGLITPVSRSASISLSLYVGYTTLSYKYPPEYRIYNEQKNTAGQIGLRFGFIF